MTTQERQTIIRRNAKGAAEAILANLDTLEDAVILTTHGKAGTIKCLAGTEIGTIGLSLIAIFDTLDAAPDEQTRAQLGMSTIQHIMNHLQNGGNQCY